jgi:hypothetical protein
MAKLPGPIELEISELAGIFADTENPAAAWRAFALARQNNLPVPPNVDAEIVRFADAVTAPLETDRDTITEKTLTAAWGLKVGFKPAPELRNARRDWDVWLYYWELRRGGVDPEPGVGRDAAIAETALKFGKSPKTIEGILTYFTTKYGDGDPFENPAFREA